MGAVECGFGQCQLCALLAIKTDMNASEADLGDVELGEGLPVASLPAVVLLPVHLEDCEFGPLHKQYIHQTNGNTNE